MIYLPLSFILLIPQTLLMKVNLSCLYFMRYGGSNSLTTNYLVGYESLCTNDRRVWKSSLWVLSKFLYFSFSQRKKFDLIEIIDRYSARFDV